jgi:hypothetical protein
MTEQNISRRAALKGLGTISIGLPFLEEMCVSKAFAAAGNPVPVRAFKPFLRSGYPCAPAALEGFEGVLEPLKPLSDKLLIMRRVDQVRCDQSGINAHFDGASGAFTAEPPKGEAKAGGPSIDQLSAQTSLPRWAALRCGSYGCGGYIFQAKPCQSLCSQLQPGWDRCGDHAGAA